MKQRAFLTAWLILCLSCHAWAWRVSAIQVRGQQHVSRQHILHHFPIKVGQSVDHDVIEKAIQSLYTTGYFSHVAVYRDGHMLRVQVNERVRLIHIEIEGNRHVKEEIIQKILAFHDVKKASFLDPYALKKAENDIVTHYNMQGYQAVDVKMIREDQGDHRVTLQVLIKEGHPLTVRNIRLKGNHALSSRQLRHVIELSPKLWSFITHNNHYAKEKWYRDQQRVLQLYYRHGYLDAKIVAVHTQHHPNKTDVDLSLVLSEGKPYVIDHVQLHGGKKGVDVSDLWGKVKKGRSFQNDEVMRAKSRILARYADHGYAHGSLAIKTRLKKNQKVDLIFNLTTHQPVLVRRITFEGNRVTTDRVLRREMQQMEYAIYHQGKIDESIRRLNNLGYLKHVNCHLKPVDGREDMSDLACQVEEVSSLVASASVGFSSQEGLLYQLAFNQSNLLGTGKTLALNLQHTRLTQSAKINYVNPYYRSSGVSRGMTLFFQRTTPEHVNITNYKSNQWGGRLFYSFPITHYDRIQLGLGFSHIRLLSFESAGDLVKDFISKHGANINDIKWSMGWQHHHLDRAIFPRRGLSHGVSIDIGLPANNSLRYMIATYQLRAYHPLAHTGWIAYLHAGAGYGRGYGKHDEGLPFFKHFYAGGIGSVRGFKANGLGPKDAEGHALGGHILAHASLNLILPPFSDHQVRSMFFVDAGSVYDQAITWDQTAASVGLAVQWRTMIAPLVLVLGVPVHSQAHDARERFAFTLATSM